MIKATMTASDGTQILLIGLSHKNLEKLKADGIQGFIQIRGKLIELPIDVIIMAGETEQTLMDGLNSFIGPTTKIVDTR